MTDPSPEVLFRAFLVALGADLEGEHAGMADSVALFTGLLRRFLAVQEEPSLTRLPASSAQLVTLSPVHFHSLCEHHLVPFMGSVDIAYVPDAYIAGLGGFHRCVEYFSWRPQLQERLTEQVGMWLAQALAPKGLAVRTRARQLCFELTGGSVGTVVTAWYRMGCLSDTPRSEIFPDA